MPDKKRNPLIDSALAFLTVVVCFAFYVSIKSGAAFGTSLEVTFGMVLLLLVIAIGVFESIIRLFGAAWLLALGMLAGSFRLIASAAETNPKFVYHWYYDKWAFFAAFVCLVVALCIRMIRH